MHQSPLRSPPRASSYDNAKTKPSSSDGRLGAVAIVFVFVLALFGALVYQVYQLTANASAMDRRRELRAGAEEAFWAEMVGHGRPFLDVIPRSQFTVERGHALEYTATHNIKECAERCVENDLCTAFSFVGPHTQEDRFDNARPTRCILVSGHFTSTALDAGTIVRRDPEEVRRLRKLRDDAANAGAMFAGSTAKVSS